MNAIEKYKEIEKLLTIIGDTDHPLANKLRNEISIEQIEMMKTYIEVCEDAGMHLVAYPKN